MDVPIKEDWAEVSCTRNGEISVFMVGLRTESGIFSAGLIIMFSKILLKDNSVFQKIDRAALGTGLASYLYLNMRIQSCCTEDSGVH